MNAHFALTRQAKIRLYILIAIVVSVVLWASIYLMNNGRKDPYAFKVGDNITIATKEDAQKYIEHIENRYDPLPANWWIILSGMVEAAWDVYDEIYKLERLPQNLPNVRNGTIPYVEIVYSIAEQIINDEITAGSLTSFKVNEYGQIVAGTITILNNHISTEYDLAAAINVGTGGQALGFLTSNFWVVPTVHGFFYETWLLSTDPKITFSGEWLTNTNYFYTLNESDFNDLIDFLESSLFSIKLAEHGSFGFGFGMRFYAGYDINTGETFADVHFANPDTTYFYPHSYFFQNAYEERILETI